MGKTHTKPTGRKNRYEALVQPRLTTIKYWREGGLTEKEICKNLGVSVSRFATYKLAHEELREALKNGKEDCDAQVINALKKRAVGYEFTETKYIFDIDPKTGKANATPSKVEKTVKQMEPNVVAQIFYAKNRLRNGGSLGEDFSWKDRQEVGHSGPDGEALAVGTVIFDLGDNGHGPGSATAKPKGEGG